MRRIVTFGALILAVSPLAAQLTLRPDIQIPELPGFRPLPPPDVEFTRAIHRIVEDVGLNVMTPASQNPDSEDEWASICVVDLADVEHPRVGGWQMTNFVYPASAYKMYVLGEAIREVCAGQLDLDQTFTVEAHNVRADSHLVAGQEATLSELLRLMVMHSDNSAANVCIDIVDRQRASALMRAMGCFGSDITRKYLSRSLEDPGYADVPGTTSCALHFATFLWAAETGAIGGGRGRGLIKGYLGMTVTGASRIRAGLPDSATLCHKTGTWDIFNCDVGLVEDGPTRYILCILTAMPSERADPLIAEFTRRVHGMLSR